MLSVKVLLPGYKHLGTKVDPNRKESCVEVCLRVYNIFLHSHNTCGGWGEAVCTEADSEIIH